MRSRLDSVSTLDRRNQRTTWGSLAQRWVMLTPLVLAAAFIVACGSRSAPAGSHESRSSALVISATEATEVIFSNFGPGMTFDTDPFHGWTINGYQGPNVGQQAIAEQFTPAANYTFTEVQVPLVLWSGTGVLSIYLHSEAAGLPGPVLAELPVTISQFVPTIVKASSVTRPRLQAGNRYWISIVAGAPGLIAGWNWNSIGDECAGNGAGTQGGSATGPWGLCLSGSLRAAFAVSGLPVLPVDVRIGGGAGPACVNPASRGQTTARIYGADSVEVDRINTATLALGGALSPRCHRAGSGSEAHLVCQFATDAVSWPPRGTDCGTVLLTGSLEDGTLIRGSVLMCLAGEPTCEDALPVRPSCPCWSDAELSAVGSTYPSSTITYWSNVTESEIAERLVSGGFETAHATAGFALNTDSTPWSEPWCHYANETVDWTGWPAVEPTRSGTSRALTITADQAQQCRDTIEARVAELRNSGVPVPCNGDFCQ